uniref:PAS domain-containing protein n=1 Tax=Macrostomum lignano TaxID=282301 RepID=A0A1I8ISU6_9PLAT
MKRPAACDFLYGPLTSVESITSLRDSLEINAEHLVHITLYRKDGSRFNADCVTSPVRSDSGSVVFYIVTLQPHLDSSCEQIPCSAEAPESEHSGSLRRFLLSSIPSLLRRRNPLTRRHPSRPHTAAAARRRPSSSPRVPRSLSTTAWTAWSSALCSTWKPLLTMTPLLIPPGRG